MARSYRDRTVGAAFEASRGRPGFPAHIEPAVQMSLKCLMTTTGQAACWTHSWLTDPSLSPAKPPPAPRPQHEHVGVLGRFDQRSADVALGDQAGVTGTRHR